MERLIHIYTQFCTTLNVWHSNGATKLLRFVQCYLFLEKTENEMHFWMNFIEMNEFWMILLPVGGRINQIYCRLRALETHLGLWHAEFVSEILWFQQNCCGPLTNIQVEILHPIACIAHLYKNSFWLKQFVNSSSKIRRNFKIFGIKQKHMIQAKICGFLTYALHWIPLDRLFWWNKKKNSINIYENNFEN